MREWAPLLLTLALNIEKGNCVSEKHPAPVMSLSRQESHKNLSIGQMNKKITLIQERRGGKSTEVRSELSQEGFSELIKSLSIVACTVIGQRWDELLK